MSILHQSENSIAAAAMYIDGQWQTVRDQELLQVENPADESTISYIVNGTVADADAAVHAAKAAFVKWSVKPAIERASYVQALADEMQKELPRLAALVTAEQGKPIRQAKDEIDAAITFLRFAAEQARRISGDIVTSDNLDEEIHIRKHPYGVVVGLTAWNYPAALVTRKLGPALVSGNTFILLSHENTPLSGLAIAELAQRVGIPDGVFNVLTGKGPVVGQRLVEHPDTSLITMTGSTRAGIQIARSASDGLKVVRLELGGKAPFIVMDDADVDAAVTAAVDARYTNCGQVCTCNERMYLHDKIADQFLEKFIAASQAMKIGDPNTDVDIGPKVSGLEVEKIEEIVQRGITNGAEILLRGGALNDGVFEKGHWFAPTILEVADNGSPLMQEEIFGPVVAAKRVVDFEEAVHHANDTSFGLSAYLFTQQAKRVSQAPYLLKYGEVYINRSLGEAVQGFHSGWGMSGLGGEDGQYGFDAYMRKQTTYLNWG